MTGDRTVSPRRALSSDAEAAAGVWLRSFAAALPGVVRPRSDDEVRDHFRHVLVPLRETWVAQAAGGGVVGVMVLEGEEPDVRYVWRP